MKEKEKNNNCSYTETKKPVAEASYETSNGCLFCNYNESQKENCQIYKNNPNSCEWTHR